MANVTVTSANVSALPENGAVMWPPVHAGGTVTIGYLVYVDSNGAVQHADADVSAATASAIGIAVESFDGETSVASGNPVGVCVFGPVSGFSDLTPGADYYVSDTVGRISDAAGTCSRLIGKAVNANVLWVHPQQNVPSSA